ASLDHLVGERQQPVWNLEAERLGGLEVEDKLQCCWSHDRQFGGLRAPDDLPGIDADLTVDVAQARPIAHQPTGTDELAPFICYRQAIFGRQSHDAVTAGPGEGRASAEQRAGP